MHIYRLVSERTIEENILTKSDQKRRLDHLAIQSGGFNTEHILQKFNPRELLGLKGAPAPACRLIVDVSGSHGMRAPLCRHSGRPARVADQHVKQLLCACCNTC